MHPSRGVPVNIALHTGAYHGINEHMTNTHDHVDHPCAWRDHITPSRVLVCPQHSATRPPITAPQGRSRELRIPGVDGAVALRGDSRELSYLPGGLLWRDRSS